MITNFLKTGTIKSDYISEYKQLYLQTHIEKVYVYTSDACKDAKLIIIKKKDA
jgi:hypothetical protein